jgi:hypothetical protein
MNIKKNLAANWVILLGLLVVFSCGEKKEQTPEITQQELTAAVPELRDLHDAVYPLWHDAFPNKDYAHIKELLPELDSLTAKVETAKLPGILQDKKNDWEAGKEKLVANLKKLHEAADSDNKEEMLAQTEAFHSNYEKLVRTIRPLVEELDSFHQEMYKLYHYYMPNYDLEKIRETVIAMQKKLTPLKEAKLHRRLEDRKDQFDTAVAELETAVNNLADVVQKDDKEAIKEAAEEVHTYYQGCEAVFN